MSANENAGPVVPGHVAPEVLEAAPKPWYDDLNVFVVAVSGFISTVLTVVIIFVVQGLYFHWEFDEILRKSESRVSPAQMVVDAQKETLARGAVVESLSGSIEGELYYPNVDETVMVSIDEAKAKVLKKYGGQASE